MLFIPDTSDAPAWEYIGDKLDIGSHGGPLEPENTTGKSLCSLCLFRAPCRYELRPVIRLSGWPSAIQI
jgi:hypothetical protein